MRNTSITIQEYIVTSYFYPIDRTNTVAVSMYIKIKNVQLTSHINHIHYYCYINIIRLTIFTQLTLTSKHFLAITAPFALHFTHYVRSELYQNKSSFV